MTLSAAYNFAKSRRPQVQPNSTFMRILEEYGKELQQRKNGPAKTLVNNTNNNANFVSQENINFNFADSMTQAPANKTTLNLKNNESYFYGNTRNAPGAPQAQYPSSFGLGTNKISSTNMALFGFPHDDNYTNSTFNNLNFEYNSNRNRYVSHPNLSNIGVGGGVKNLQYF